MSFIKHYVSFILLVFILIFAFFLRSKMFLAGDFYYLLDQARDMMLTQSIVVGHKFTLVGARTGLGGLFHGPLWIYMLTPFFILAKGDPYVTLVPLFEIVSLATIAVGFFVGLRLYGKWTGLLFALFLSLSQPLIQTVPGTSNSQVLPIVFFLYLYAIVKFMRGEEGYFIAAMFFAGLGFQFESAFAILLLPLTVTAVVLKGKLPSVKHISLGIASLLVAVSTFILFDLRHKFLMTTSFIKLFTYHVKPLPGYEQYARIDFRIHDRLMNLWSSLFSPLFTGDKLTSFILLSLIAAGISYLIKDILHTKKLTMKNKEYLFILTAPLIIFGIYILYPLPLWDHYLLPIVALAVFILGLSIRNLWTVKIVRVVIGIFIASALYPAFLWIQNNYSSPYQSTSDGSYRNQLEVAKWVLADDHNKPYGYFEYTTGILTYNMDYLLSYESHKNHLIAPSNLKHTITYLIMYPHAVNDKNAYDFWKKHVVRTAGKTLYSKTFPSGITVEKLEIADNEEPADPNYYQNLLFR